MTRESTPEWEDYATSQAERYLARARNARAKAEYLMAELEDARRFADGLKAVRYGEGGARAADPDGAMVSAVGSMDAMAARLSAKAAECAALMSEASERISSLESPQEARLLSLYYVQGLPTWGKVAEAMGYSTASVYRVRESALLSFYDAMPHVERDPLHRAV